MKRPVEIIEKHLGRFAINLCEAVDHLSLTEAVCKIIEQHHVKRCNRTIEALNWRSHFIFRIGADLTDPPFKNLSYKAFRQVPRIFFHIKLQEFKIHQKSKKIGSPHQLTRNQELSERLSSRRLSLLNSNRPDVLNWTVNFNAMSAIE